MSDFLLELHTEELPPKGLVDFAQNLKSNLIKELDKSSISYDEVTQYSTPRRIAVVVSNILTKTENQTESKKGPHTSASTKAIEGFAKSVGVKVNELNILTNNKGEYYYHNHIIKGIQTKDIIIELCNTAIEKMHFTRPMRWGSNPFSFIRPVHLVIALLDDQVINGQILGITTNNITYGLRSNPHNIIISHANQYRNILLNNGIEVDFLTRKELIAQQIQTIATSANVVVIENDALLNEVTCIVENPKTFIGEFDKKFLDLPVEVISESMAEHQKYFTVLSTDGKLQNNFIAVSNNNPKDMSVIISGNEKVVRPRLADAEFFYNTDKSTSLESKLDKLKTVLFIKDIGSMYDKTQRIIKLSEYIAHNINADINTTLRAAKLLKADLTSNMVLEFTSLQGIMGGYYAQYDNEDAKVVNALKTQYQPKFAGDDIPNQKVSIAVNIADKLDTICGVFLVGNAPTGSKDPFALRRLSLGILRIIIENKIHIDLIELINKTLSLFPLSANETLATTIHTFMIERLKGYYEERHISTNIFNSAFIRSNDAYDFDKRIHALVSFMSTQNSNATELIDANKRISNILKDSKYSQLESLELSLEIEQSLYLEISTLEHETDYEALINKLNNLRPLLDRFFLEVMINDKDDVKRTNRLNLISKIRMQFLKIGDFTKLL